MKLSLHSPSSLASRVQTGISSNEQTKPYYLPERKRTSAVPRRIILVVLVVERGWWAAGEGGGGGGMGNGGLKRGCWTCGAFLVPPSAPHTTFTAPIPIRPPSTTSAASSEILRGNHTRPSEEGVEAKCAPERHKGTWVPRLGLQSALRGRINCLSETRMLLRLWTDITTWHGF